MTEKPKKLARHHYRPDIDGLRAVAVVAVILFHLGHFPNGYLGVDVFFVISGFLITGIIKREQSENRFSFVDFYLRRIRRIIPLTLFVCGAALALGAYTMLPDDFENLAQSVIATNIFSNNILQAVTTRNYWDVVNEYKPLMHTWSLAVEEQYYIVYPVLFLLIPSSKRNSLIAVVGTLAAFSLILTWQPYETHQKFYYIFFRFWELAAGGLAALLLNGLINSTITRVVSLFVLVVVLFSPVVIPNATVSLIITVGLTLGILVTENKTGKRDWSYLDMAWLVAIGRISFSLYMWHQIVLAYMRYLWTQELHLVHLVVFFVVTFILSILSYYAIEQPFRDRKRMKTSTVLLTVLLGVVATTGFSFYVYQRAGVIKDFPELGIEQSNIQRGLHGAYNERVRTYNEEFEDDDRINVLVIGNSFARDWANVILESNQATRVELSYSPPVDDFTTISPQVSKADVIFYSIYSTPEEKLGEKVNLPVEKVWAVGTKNFGHNNGVFYNYVGSQRHAQRTKMKKGHLELEAKLKRLWGDRLISYLDKVLDDDGTMPVFTTSKQFISQDCRHLTQMGARYFADLFKDELKTIFDAHDNSNQQ